MLQSARATIATVSSILIIINIVGNCLVCAIIKKNRDMRTPMNYLLVNLAVADILYAVFFAPYLLLRLYSVHPEGILGTVMCKLVTCGTVAWIGAASSVVTLVAIAIERYYAVVYPLGNNRELTGRKLKVIILGSWIFSVILCTPGVLIREVKRKVCEIIWLGRYHWMWIIFVVLSLALMIGFYSKVVYALWFKSNDDNLLTHQQRGVTRVRKRVTFMAVTVTAIFGICWLTDQVVHLADAFLSYSINKDVYIVTHTMVLFSSASNPLAYALVSRNFRQKIKGMMCSAHSKVVVHPVTRDLHAAQPDNLPQSIHTAGPCPIVD